MKTLAIDTSTEYLSLTISEEENVLAKLHEFQGMKRSDLLISKIDRLLGKCNLNLGDIDAIVLSIGPGSFTGLRISVTACKAINMATKIPIVAVPTLDVIAYNFVKEKYILCPIVDAKKSKVYSCIYKVVSGKLKRLSDYMLTDPENLISKIKSPTLLFGNGVKLYEKICKQNPFVHISQKDWVPKAEFLGKLAILDIKKKRFANPDKLVPMYLHSKYCQIKGYNL